MPQMHHDYPPPRAQGHPVRSIAVLLAINSFSILASFAWFLNWYGNPHQGAWFGGTILIGEFLLLLIAQAFLSYLPSMIAAAKVKSLPRHFTKAVVWTGIAGPLLTLLFFGCILAFLNIGYGKGP